MIKIGIPHVMRIANGKVRLAASVADDVYGWQQDLWYEVGAEYEDWLCAATSDSFVLALLVIAVVSGQDVKVEGAVSAKLLYHFENTLIPLYSKFFYKDKLISVQTDMVSCQDLCGDGVATGCSLGIDSLSSIFKHIEKPASSGYKLTHLTFFNCGQLGDEGVEEWMKKALVDVRAFAEKVSLPLVVVNSNLNDFYVSSGVEVRVSIATRSISCALALQKLFGKYVYASSFPASEIKFDRDDFASFDAAVIPLLSTESCEVVSGDSMLTRVEKTRCVAANELSRQFLTVCWAEQSNNQKYGNHEWIKGKTKVNCGWCDKCLRTLLTLELMGINLVDYANIFELSKYYERKNHFIEKIALEKDENVFYHEIYSLLGHGGVKASVIARVAIRRFVRAMMRHKWVRVVLIPILRMRNAFGRR